VTWMKWLPWRFVIRYVARRQGFLDPVALLARLHDFAQPSEVGVPIELLRAGMVFHARGLINSRVIQHNLDWVWPYWVERQFDPNDPAFIPRAFSITHVNLTHRNWTAIGYPDVDELPIVDPRGLLTPRLDGFSLDGWLMTRDGHYLVPSRADNCRQHQDLAPEVSVTTETRSAGLMLISRAWVELHAGSPACMFRLTARSDSDGWLVLALRPQNPEGVSFIHEIRLLPDRKGWQVDDAPELRFSQRAERHHVSDYRHGDVHIHLEDREDQTQGRCDVGLATAAAMFPVKAGESAEVTVTLSLARDGTAALPPDAWNHAYRERCNLECPDSHFQFLYDAAVTSLVLHSPDDVYPGPYTYKRFWFRDAAFIIHAMLCAGLTDRAQRTLDRFPERQTPLGYFRSQEGEWDANGEVLWIFRRYTELTGRAVPSQWRKSIQSGARWIIRKRLDDTIDAPHAGLLPPGFSAEHLGPNDYYFWDDFWGIGGLRAAAQLCADSDPGLSLEFGQAADAFSAAVDRSLAACAERLQRPAMPASPYRRLDAGAIGSLALGYPLQLGAARDERLLDSVEFLLQRCFVKGAFYQDMIHSGLNAYLTLHVAQVLLRAGDPRYLALMDTVAAIASPTGQWPEAIHPATGGGCMGDGHHVWAAAEWVLMLRHCFVREEGDGLVLGSGIPERWLILGQPIRFGPAPTSFGPVSLCIQPRAGDTPVFQWRGQWRNQAPRLEIRLPGFEAIIAQDDRGDVPLVLQESSP
jgi:hypothetical protein